MDRWTGKTAVVTGASAGIGAAIAVALADAGMNVVAGARRLDKLQDLQTQVTGRGRIIPVQCDVSKEDDVIKIIAHAKKYGGVDVLVNNAAVLPTGTISGSNNNKAADITTIEDCFKINVLAVINATRLAVHDMAARKFTGHVIIINSIAGHRVVNTGVNNVSVYGATKYAITNLAETLRLEFSMTNTAVRITSISPGAVDTDMLSSIKSALSSSQIPMLKPQDVAGAVMYALSTPDTVNISELTIQPVGEKF